MTPEQVKTIFHRFKKQNPNPSTELIFHSPFELLIAVILSAQATDTAVNQATKVLYTTANTPEKILALGEQQLKQYIKTIGLYHTKAKNIIKTCSMLLAEYNGRVPKTRSALESLPGVGRKTANVVLNTVFEKNTIAVDTHIFRVSNRTGLAPGKTPLAVENKLMHVIPKYYLKPAHHWLLLHGRYICRARAPKCPKCLINDLCEYPDKTQ